MLDKKYYIYKANRTLGRLEHILDVGLTDIPYDFEDTHDIEQHIIEVEAFKMRAERYINYYIESLTDIVEFKENEDAE